jgi:hypothetical protein
MANVHRTKIHTIESLAAGAKYRFQWNNPPAGVIAYFVVPNPKTPSGQHGVTHGTVEMGKVTTHRTKDNFNEHEASYSAFDIVNTGDEATGVDIYQTWLD